VADAPWRCSQCGTVNEPVANACRTCGRWPSLFELEGSTIEPDAPAAAEDEFPAEALEVDDLEPEAFDEPGLPEGNGMPPEFELDDEDEEPPGTKSRRRRLVRLILPIGIAAYVLITALADRG
jgi:hypothetical protein